MTKGREAIPRDIVANEAKTLMALWNAARTAGAVGPQDQVGETYEIGSQSAVGQFLRGDKPLSLKAACGFAAALRCTLADFSPRLAAEAQTAAQFVQPKGWPFRTIRMDEIPAPGDPRLAQLEAVMRAVLVVPHDLVETSSFAGTPPPLHEKPGQPTFPKHK